MNTHIKALDAVAVAAGTGSFLNWFTPTVGAVAGILSIIWLSLQFYLFVRDKKWRRE
jgi:hypothetical protein